MKRIHNSLKRQLKQHFGGLDSIPKEWQAFVETVNDAYWESDRNRIALEDTLKSTTENLTYASSELHALFQVLPDLFLILDSENVILECQCRTGIDSHIVQEDFRGKRIDDVSIDQVSNELREAIHEVRNTKSIVRVEYATSLQKRMNFYEARLLPLPGNRVIAVVRNTTEHKWAELEIQKLQRYNRGLIETSLDPLVTFNQKGIILDVNEATIQATGRNREELIGTPFANYFKDPERARKGAMMVFKKGEVRDYELVMKGRDGTETTVAYNASLYRDQTGEVIAAFAAARDITDLKRSEAEVRLERDRVKVSIQKLVDMQDKLIRSERFAAIGEAASYLSHEIRNPLMVIGGLAGVIEESLSDDDANRVNLEIIQREIKRLESMLTNVTDFTRPSRLKKGILDINSAIKNAMTLMENDLRNKKINCEQSLDGDLPSISFDPEQIKQVLINLLKNAAEAMPNGGKLAISSWREDGYVKVSFTDSGTGMSAKIAQKVFNPFFTTKKKGTGLGLAVSRRIMEDHGGEISLQSKKGKGTRAVISLPIHAEENASN